MKKISSIILILFVLTGNKVKSQENTFYISGELGSKYHLFNVSNYSGDNEFNSKKWSATPVLALTVGKKRNDISIESGLILHQYSYLIKGNNFALGSHAFVAIQIPFRLKYDILCKSTKWDLNIAVGYNLGIKLENTAQPLNSEDRASLSLGSYSLNEDGVPIDSTFTGMRGGVYRQGSTFHLLEARAEVAYNFNFGLGIYAGVSRLSGFDQMIEIDAVHQKNNEPINRARYSSNGDYISVFFGAKYLIGANKDKKVLSH